MSKFNFSLATALTASVVATLSAAQVPAARTAGAAQQREQIATPNPGSAHDEARTPAARTGVAGAAGEGPAVAAAPAAPVATATVPPTAAASPAPPQVAWPNSVPQNTNSELREGTVSSTGQVRIGSEPAIPGRTYEYRFSGTLDVANVVWRSGRGYDLFSERDAAWRLGLGFTYDAIRLPQNLVFAVEAGFLYEPAHGDKLDPLFGSLSGSLSATTIHVGPALRWAVTPWLAPHARVGVLATSFNMNLDASGGPSWSYQKWAAGALLGGGVMVTLPPLNPVNVGLLFEGGYWLQRDVPIQLARDLPRDAIATASARVGTLENTGPYLRIAGVLRF